MSDVKTVSLSHLMRILEKENVFHPLFPVDHGKNPPTTMSVTHRLNLRVTGGLS